MKRALITGAGGFIGNHLTRYLKDKGYWIRGIDLKHPEWSDSLADEFVIGDLRDSIVASSVMKDIQFVYALAADMGGIGYIESNHAQILYNNTLINLNTLEAARQHKVLRYLFTSSACVYNETLQEGDARSLKEEDACPAQPDTAYGWEKLFAEICCTHYMDDYGATHNMDVRLPRFHAIYGPEGTYKGGREKAPAALCRKVATAKLTGEHIIEIWGDGRQVRSFCYIDDCLEMLYLLMQSRWPYPLNIGTDEDVTINRLVNIIEDAAGLDYGVDRKYIMTGAQGVRSRNADLSKMRKVLFYDPQVSLRDGIKRLYDWVEGQVRKDLGI